MPDLQDLKVPDMLEAREIGEAKQRKPAAGGDGANVWNFQAKRKCDDVDWPILFAIMPMRLSEIKR